MVETGWALELPTVQAAQELAEAGERRAERIERARQDEEKARVAEHAAAAEVGVWMAQLRGEALPTESEVLARGREDTRFPGDQDRQRRHRAREILRQYGLDDLLGGGSGVILDANMGVVEPSRGAVQRSAADVDDGELAQLVKRNEEDRAYVESIRRSRSPFARRGAVVRSESCQHCIDQGVDDETSYLLHSDPERPVPVTPPGWQPAEGQTDRQQAEVERLMNLGYSWETAQLAARPYGAGMAVR